MYQTILRADFGFRFCDENFYVNNSILMTEPHRWNMNNVWAWKLWKCWCFLEFCAFVQLPPQRWHLHPVYSPKPLGGKMFNKVLHCFLFLFVLSIWWWCWVLVMHMLLKDSELQDCSKQLLAPMNRLVAWFLKNSRNGSCLFHWGQNMVFKGLFLSSPEQHSIFCPLFPL